MAQWTKGRVGTLELETESVLQLTSLVTLIKAH